MTAFSFGVSSMSNKTRLLLKLVHQFGDKKTIAGIIAKEFNSTPDSIAVGAEHVSDNAVVSPGEKVCFYVTPIGEDHSKARREADGFLASIIAPVVKEVGYEVTASHHISKSGSITKTIVQHLLADGLVVVNLTGLNANVMYEMALRHATFMPVVLIAEHGTVLPFDLKDERTIFYDNDIVGAEELRNKLKDAVESALNDSSDNPISRAQAAPLIPKLSMIPDTDGYIVQQLQEISQKLDMVVKVPPLPWEPIGTCFTVDVDRTAAAEFFSAVLDVTDDMFEDIRQLPGAPSGKARAEFLCKQDIVEIEVEGILEAAKAEQYGAVLMDVKKRK